MAEEERFTRQRYSPNQLPTYATAYCLSEAGVTLDDVDIVAFGWDYPRLFRSLGEDWSWSERELLEFYLPSRLFPRSRDPRIEMIPHHLAHAASAFYASPFYRAAIIVVDGRGESEATTLAYGEGDTITEFLKIPISFSVGNLYSRVTERLGFDWYHAGKTMGLAAYGRNVYGSDFLELTERGYRFNLPGRHLVRAPSGVDEEVRSLKLMDIVLSRLTGQPRRETRQYYFDQLEGRFAVGRR